MKFFFLFAPYFHAVPLVLAQRLNDRFPEASFAGLSTGSRSVFDSVASSRQPAVQPIYWLDDLERNWLQQPSDNERMAYYEDLLGGDMIRRMIIADRQIGGALVFDSVSGSTPLRSIAADTEMVKRYVIGVLDWAFDVFRSFRPDLVFCYTVAGAPAFALSIVSRHLGVPFARISSAHVASKFLIEDSIELKLDPANRKFASALQNPEILAHTIDDAKAYLKQFRSRPKKYDGSAYNHARVLQSLSPRRIAARAYAGLRSGTGAVVRREQNELRRAKPFQRTWEDLKQSLSAHRSLKADFPPQVGELPDRPFVYFPLQVSPEASTMVLSPMHTNQLMLIEALAKSTPLSLDILVKEHIPMVGKRPKGFYRQLRAMPGVRLISPFEDTFSLIQKSALVCTVTGTAAWEAIKLRKPAIVFGAPHFCALEQGIVHCPDLSKLPQAVKNALELDPVDDDRLELYIAAILDVCFDLPKNLYRTGVTFEQVEQQPEPIEQMCDQLVGLLSVRESDTVQ